MTMGTTPLQYKITSWEQLPKCLSNNSRDYFITVSKFVNDDRMNGICIRVNHKTFGVVFACLVGCSGSILSQNEDNRFAALTPDQILSELAKFGYQIIFDPIVAIPGDQIEFLMTLSQLQYDKIRILSVWDTVSGMKIFRHFVVAFKVDHLPKWLQASYSPSVSEYVEALKAGSAFCVDTISDSRRWGWDWLVNWVANINDILADYELCGVGG